MEFRVALTAAAFLLVAPAGAAGQTAETYSPPAGESHPVNVYWGDTHVHTSFSSSDANLSGENRDTPELAYRFARGDVVEARNGMPARIRRPLDFLVIADHAESLGVSVSIQTADPALLTTPIGRTLYDEYQRVPDVYDDRRTFSGRIRSVDDQLGGAYKQTVWNRVVASAEAFNDPGTFTTFAGYEWTSRGSDPAVFGNLHRVVIFRDGPELTGAIYPFSSLDSRDPEDLWAFLERYEASTGGAVLAIPHNGNVSNGEMFALTDYDGNPLTAEYARARSAWEPLYEVTQIKGDSETHPILSPTDEFADFETWHSWAGTTTDPTLHTCCPDRRPEDEAALKPGEYARSALRRGLVLERELGVNPFRFGMIGSTDAHSSLATADNDNFWGKYSYTYPSPTRMTDQFVRAWAAPLNWETAAAGYAAVWAEENTRESIFAAMERREVYASTGPRITARVFGGWEFVPDDAVSPDMVRIGYAGGVPIGGELTGAPAGAAPTFLIGALRDPDGANLDRVQVIKGWLDAAGESHEQVYDVALSDGRVVAPDGSVPPVGSTVDVADATYGNTIGDAQFLVHWRDPDFDAAEPAFYYVRILEIPTPRWTAYDAKYFGLDPGEIPDEVPMITQERIYTSPIWYSP